MTRCKFHACHLTRPLNALEAGMGWHIPCLNAKHAQESREGWKLTTPKMKEQAARQYAKRTKQEVMG